MTTSVKLLVIVSVLIAVRSNGDWNYPETKTVDVSDTYFGKKYPDPYRWLEDSNNKKVQAWFKVQAELTDELLGRISGRDALTQEWLEWDKHKTANYYGICHENGRGFYKKDLPGESVGKLYFQQGWNGVEKVLFDPDGYRFEFAGLGSLKGITTLGSFTPSPDGKHVAIGITRGGSDFAELRILGVDRGELLPERIYPSGGCFAWTPDGRSFFYDAGKISNLTSPDINRNRKTKLHELGTDVTSDRDFFSDESYPDLGLAPVESPVAFFDEHNPRYIFAKVFGGPDEFHCYYAPVAELKQRRIKWNVLCKIADDLGPDLMPVGDDIYAVSHRDAPRGKVIRTSLKHPDWEHAETIVPEKTDVLGAVAASKHYLLMRYFRGGVCGLFKYDIRTGVTKEIKLPVSGNGLFQCLDWKADRWLVYVTSWTVPTTAYDFDARKDRFTKSSFNSPVPAASFTNMVAEEVEVPGHDGVMIPMSIVYRKGLSLNGSNSCIVQAYGALGATSFPLFSTDNFITSEDVVMAYAHVRGGGDKGEAWHKAGFKSTKPNTWKDFISCAEYLIAKKYTSSQKLAAFGVSAGGIPISRAITERPELFAAAVCDVPVVNPMRFEFTPNGPSCIPEFGTVKDPVECQALFEMDGLQHVRKGQSYPAVMAVGGWNDPRVSVWQPGKFVAALQAASTSDRPVLLKVNYSSGHSTEDKTISFEDLAGQFAFLLWQTGHEDFQPVK